MPVGAVLKSDGSGRSYYFGRVLGEGGFGITYIGKELASGIKVAIKEYFPNMCNPTRMENGEIRPIPQKADAFEKGRESFLREASMLIALRDVDGIVHVMDFFQANATAYIVMEYLDGVTLKNVVSRSGPMDCDTAIKLFIPLMQSIQHIHDAGVIHRDIAPDNIMLMPNGTLTLFDFGCARSTEDGRSMTILLKPGFAPIEQYTRHDQDTYTDVYALCATIYFCITGCVPKTATDRLYAMGAGAADPMASISSFGIAIPINVEQAIMKGCALQPAERTQRVKDLMLQLDPSLYPPPPPPPPPSFQWEKYRIPALIALGIVATIALIVLIFFRF